jgi:putative glutamine amidotransferase
MSLIVGIPACNRDVNGLIQHATPARYGAAVIGGAGAMPILLPPVGEGMVALLDRLDGLLVSGSPSNVEPHNYGVADSMTPGKHDPQRDRTTLPMIRAALARGLPVLAICRGIQELNVALGGSLHQQLHAEPGMMDHREPQDDDLAVQFAVRHDVELLPGSAFAQWAGGTKAKVNSLHAQGIKRLGRGLVAEAFAPDGLVEGVRIDGAPAFGYGVQWHPEWQHETNPFYQRTLDAFAQACVERRKRRESV